MRILVDIRHLAEPNPAGVGGYTKHLLDALFRLDKTNEYFLFASGWGQAVNREAPIHGLTPSQNVQTIFLPIPNKILNAGLITGRINLESLLTQRLNDLPAGRQGSTTQRLPDLCFFPNLNFFHTNLPYIITAHDLSFEIFPEFFSAKMRLWHNLVNPARAFNKAHAVLAPSESTKQDMIKLYGVSAERIHVVPLASEQLNNSLGHSPTGKPTAQQLSLPPRYLLSVCTLEPRKNHLSIIEAYEQYRDKTGDTIALVIGGKLGWKSAPILRAVKRSRYAADIHLLGYVAEEQKAELYTRAEVFLFPSFYEGFGLPVLEAMQYGCPVITSHTSSLPELTEDAALLVDPFNVNDLFAALREMLTSKHLRETLKARGQERAKAFSWEKTARETLDIFTKRT